MTRYVVKFDYKDKLTGVTETYSYNAGHIKDVNYIVIEWLMNKDISIQNISFEEYEL